MPRKPLSEKPMTSTERVQKHRARLKEATPKDEVCLENLELWRYKASISALSADLRETMAEVRMLENELYATRQRLKQTEETLVIYHQLSMSNTQQLSIADIKLLLQLSHPDKHGGSEASNKATLLLNGLKSKTKH